MLAIEMCHNFPCKQGAGRKAESHLLGNNCDTPMQRYVTMPLSGRGQVGDPHPLGVEPSVTFGYVTIPKYVGPEKKRRVTSPRC